MNASHTYTHYNTSKDLLCTTTTSDVSLLFDKDIAEILTPALQVYLPPWEVSNGSKVRVRVVLVPVVTEEPTVMLLSPTILVSLASHSSAG